MAMANDGICAPDLGPTLGVRLTPLGCRICPYRCLYCAVPDAARVGPGVRWPSPGELACAVANALSDRPENSSVTVDGAGDPTGHPAFGAAVSAVLGVVRRDRPDLPVRVRTSGTGLQRAEVRRALDLVDERVVKLDPDPERIARPLPGTPLGALVAGLSALRDLSVQGVLLEGRAGNAHPEALRDWTELLAELRPRRVYLTTPATPCAGGAARPLSAARLAELAVQVEAALGVPVEAVGA